MPGFTIDEAGLEELFNDPFGPVAEIMERAAYEVEAEAKRSLLKAGSYHRYDPGHYRLFKAGKWYAWTQTGPSHTSSQPGTPPAGNTGTLMVSLSHTMIQTDSGIGAEIGSPLTYALYLELGTRLMAPRPFLRPALYTLGVTIHEDLSETYPGAPGRLYFTPLAREGH